MATSEVITDPGPFKPGDICEGRYRIVRRLKAGGVGVVYEAEHSFTGLPVALKALYNRAGDHHERMRLEARALAEIRHPYVVQITDGGVTPEGVVWFTMELLHGRSLRGELNDVGGLGIERALRFGIQIALGVQAAHDCGVIHRDLKPENVFVVEPGDSVRVLDFGTSKFRRAQMKTTDRFRMLGTHAYMSPERLQADVTDARADVYALGHILYEMVSGMHCLSEGPGPLDLPPPYELGIRQIYAVPVPLVERAPSTPADVSGIVQRALSKKREERQQSMTEMASELEAALVHHFGSGAVTWMDATARSPRPPGTRSGSPQAEPPRQAVEGPGVIPAQQVPRGASSPPVVQPILYTERVPPHQLPDAKVEHRVQTADTEPGAPPASVRTAPVASSPAELDAALLVGAARFAVSPGNSSQVEQALANVAAAVQLDATAFAHLRALLARLPRLDQRKQDEVRRRLLALAGERDVATALKNDDLARIGNSQPDLAPGRHASMAAHGRVALGAALLVEPALRLDAAENALHALDRVDEDVQSFALSVLVAFGRSAASEYSAARGALLALLLGGPEDTELARGELAGFVLSSAQQAFATAPTLESAGAGGPQRSASPADDAVTRPEVVAPRQQAPRDPTPATPGTMTTPVGPTRPAQAHVPPARSRFSIPLAIFLALITTMVVMTIGLFVMRSHASAAAPAASAEPSTPTASAPIAAAAEPAPASSATASASAVATAPSPGASIAPVPAVAPAAPTAAAHAASDHAPDIHHAHSHGVSQHSMPSSGLDMPTSGLGTSHTRTRPAPKATASAEPKPLF